MINRSVATLFAVLATANTARAQQNDLPAHRRLRGHVHEHAPSNRLPASRSILAEPRLARRRMAVAAMRSQASVPGRTWCSFAAAALHPIPSPSTFTPDETVTHDFVLTAVARELERVIISASPRLNETTEQALLRRKSADNIVRSCLAT